MMGPIPFGFLLVLVTAGISIFDKDITPLMFAVGYRELLARIRIEHESTYDKSNFRALTYAR